MARCRTSELPAPVPRPHRRLQPHAAQVRDALHLISTLDVPAVAQAPQSADLARRVQQLEERLQQLEGRARAK